MPIELTEQEFLKLLELRLKKLLNLDANGYKSHQQLYDYYIKCKHEGYVMKFYLLDDSSLVIYPFTKEELKLYEKKYRECGIW